MTDAITRCPKCKTSFRIKADQLNSAKGAVRCGSCLNIFNAKENLVQPAKNSLASNNDDRSSAPNSSTNAENEAPSAGPESSTTTPSAEEESSIATTNDVDDDILISDDMDDNHEESDEEDFALDSNVFVAKTASKADINLFERRIQDTENNQRDHAEADESWALNLLNDTEDEEEPKSISFSEKTTLEPKAETQTSEEKKYNSVFQIIEENEYSPEAEDGEQGFEPFPGEMLDQYEDDLKAVENDEYFEEKHDPTGQNESVGDTGFFESFEAEPLEFQVQHRANFLESKLFWIPANILLVLIAISQLAAFKFDDWGRNQSLRPYYATACNLFGCELPLLQDLSAIKVDNMVVMAHPKKAQMLLVDATLLNQARFDQYFPTLLLTFSDLSNSVVSQNQFSPKEYVGGELAGKKFMPAKHPIRITLEIPDPGEHAVNYQISIIEP